MLYAIVGLLLDWEDLSVCSRPINVWLLGSFIAIFAFRHTPVAGTWIESDADGNIVCCALEARGSHIIWLCLPPVFAVWSAVGSSWLSAIGRESPQCLVNPMPKYFFAVWMAFLLAVAAYHCIGLVTVWQTSRELKQTAAELRQLEDDDTVLRWGQVSSAPTAASRRGGAGTQQRLTPAQILSLPGVGAGSCGAAEAGGEDAPICQDCSICLCEIGTSDTVRTLSGCGHQFHRSCVDLWLLRRAACPLCNASVCGHATSSAASGGEDPCNQPMNRPCLRFRA